MNLGLCMVSIAFSTIESIMVRADLGCTLLGVSG